MAQFIQALYNAFVALHFAFLEINPFCFKNDEVHILDVAAKLDHTASFLCVDRWCGPVEFPSPFGRVLTDAELYVRLVDRYVDGFPLGTNSLTDVAAN